MARLNRTFSVNKVERPRFSGTLRLPRLSISSPWINAGLKFCANRRTSHVLHLMWGALYAVCGVVQFVAGIYFMLELPIFQLGSNIWTGAWNCFSGVTIILIGCAGSVTTLKAQGFLLLSLVVAIVNLVNLVILEVGEWRGFLTTEDRNFIKDNKMEDLMYSAYLCTTISTVIAMITSFLASQHAFCFQQILAEKEASHASSTKAPNGNIVHHHHHHHLGFDHHGDHDDDSLMPKDLIKRHDDELNLKTPNGPQPHPSWVYRHNYAPFHAVARSAVASTASAGVSVKRTLSFLKSSSSSSVGKPEVSSMAPGNGNLRTISESVSAKEAAATAASGKGGRHAVIRRHQSMYIHPRATELLPPFNGNEVPAFNLHEVSGKSEVRPIVTLKRSKTTVGHFSTTNNSSSTLHYRGASTLQPPRTFRSNSVAKQMKLFDHNHNIYGTNKRKSHHYSNIPNGNTTNSATSPGGHHYNILDDICEFQAGPSFDLPDREKMRRYGWSAGNITANGNCVLLETEHHPRGKTTSYLRRPQEDLSTDSCGENIRYQAVEGLVQTTRHKMMPNALHAQSSALQASTTNGHFLRSTSSAVGQQYSSSMENLLSDRSREDDSTYAGDHHVGGMVKYGSTGSISSIGSNNHFDSQMIIGGGRAATYTPSSLYSQDSTTVPTMYFGKMSSTESVLIYDAIPKKPAVGSSTLKKSNSRVSSTGKLRLRVESFRNNKSSSGTQTDISVMRSKEEAKEANGSSDTAKYTAQYKKNTAPNKPARKHKPKSHHEHHGGESRSDRSASPDNSSTSGYSSPSAGLHSKESSPCGSKIPSPPHSLEQQPRSHQAEQPDSSSSGSHPDEDEDEEAEGDPNNRITVIQIEAGMEKKASSSDESSEDSSSRSPMMAPDVASNQASSAISNGLIEKVESKTLPFVRQTRRELPRIATNGTLGRPQQAQKRKLPETSKSQEQQRLYQQQPPPPRIYRSNLPRPAPIHQFGGRVPLPPVPELERSDHERESMSPTPSSAPSPRFRPLPSPLTTPIQPAIGRVQAKPRRSNMSPSRIPMASSGVPSTSRAPEASNSKGVEERLRSLLTLLESSKEEAKNGREDTLQYLSQLESVARRLKDQLLNDNVSDGARVMPRQIDYESEC